MPFLFWEALGSRQANLRKRTMIDVKGVGGFSLPLVLDPVERKTWTNVNSACKNVCFLLLDLYIHAPQKFSHLMVINKLSWIPRSYYKLGLLKVSVS